MALVVKDRVKETTTTSGTGTVTLAGAVTGFQSFSAIGNGNTTYYCIFDPTTGAWEVGLGTYTSSGTTLSRDTVLSSSNSGNLVNFAANAKDVFCTYPSLQSVYVSGTSIIPGTTAQLGVTYGGTGLNSAPSNGQLAIGNGTGYTLGTLTQGTGITVTNASGSITVTNASPMTYPASGIANSTGSAWGTSYSTTGSGTVVALATSPSFTTPVLGTPTSGTLTNCTGLQISGITGLGTGVGTALAAAVTGSGGIALATSPSFTTPTLGVASATTINKVTFTAPATGSTLTIADGKTLTANNSITFSGTDSTTMTFPSTSQTVAGLGVAQTWTAAQTFRAANSVRAEAASTQDAVVLAGRAGGTSSYAATITPTTLSASRTVTLPDANTTVPVATQVITFSGPTAARTVTFPDANFTVARTDAGQTFTGTQTVLAAATQDAVALAGRAGGTSSYVATITPTTLTASRTVTLPDSNTTIPIASQVITFSGPTAARTYTLPDSASTLAALGTAQTFTATNTFTQVGYTVNTVTVTTNAGTVPITHRVNNFTNSSAATMTITMATASAVDGQMSIVRIFDASAVAQTISWVNTENSTVTAPTTSNGSTTLPLTVGFMYNSATSKWRCIASA